VDFAGTIEIAAPRAAVWEFLMDFEALAACGPGVQAVEPLGPGRARVIARIGLGPITAPFSIELEHGAAQAPDSATIAGRGDAPGSQVEGRAEMRLSGPPEGPTVVAWRAEVELYGSLAGIAARLVESAAGRLIDEAFDCVRSRLSANAPTGVAEDAGGA
jgi:carbon monoxide dehydrogenase subunit G